MKRVAESAIENARNVLRSAPPKQPEEAMFSRTKAVAMLAADLERLINEKNYTADEAAELLSQGGITISATSLRNALNITKRRPGAGRPRGSTAHLNGHRSVTPES